LKLVLLLASVDINSHSPVSSTTPFFVSEEGSKFYHLVRPFSLPQTFSINQFEIYMKPHKTPTEKHLWPRPRRGKSSQWVIII